MTDFSCIYNPAKDRKTILLLLNKCVGGTILLSIILLKFSFYLDNWRVSINQIVSEIFTPIFRPAGKNSLSQKCSDFECE